MSGHEAALLSLLATLEPDVRERCAAAALTAARVVLQVREEVVRDRECYVLSDEEGGHG